MKSYREKQKELEEFKKALNDLDEKYFDGHTNFKNLTVSQKLTWLSELNYFKYIVKKNNNREQS